MLLLIGGIEWFTKGGWAMYPLALLSVLSVFLILERLFFYARHIPRVNNELENILRGTSLLPERLSGDLAPLLARSLKQGELDEKSAELAVERELLRSAQWISSLETISMVAPMFGLLGTVTGMVTVFQRIADLQGAVNPSVLAGGIWEALLTTVFGLLIAIPAIIAFRAFRSRIIRWENHLLTVVDDALQVISSRGPQDGAAVSAGAPRNSGTPAGARSSSL